MFATPTKGEWEPHKIRERRVSRQAVKETTGDAGNGPTKSEDAGGRTNGDAEEGAVEYEEDTETDEGAVYPIKRGRVRNWSCFLALLTHIHNTLSPPFHTPILLITQPAWTSQDKEMATQFCFEKFRTPAFCLMDAALAVCYAYGTPLATVIDVGYEKCDVTAVIEYLVHDVGRGAAIEGCGGEAMTQRLLELLRPQGWTRDMCEQLKRSAICEVLPRGVPLPGVTETAESGTANPTSVEATGQNVPASKRGSVVEGARINMTGTDRPEGELGAVESSDGVLDVASLVVSGKTNEFLAKKEREKAERAAKKAGAAAAAAEAAAAANKPAKLPNSMREKNTFIYEGRHFKTKASSTDGQAADQKEANKSGEPSANGQTEKIAEQPAQGEHVKREVEVGIERFRAADNGILETIADAVHRTVLAVEEVSRRAELWDSLIIVGNGSKVRGAFPSSHYFHAFQSGDSTILTIIYRLQRSSSFSSNGQTSYLSFQRHHLHFRTSLPVIYASSDRSQYTSDPASVKQ